MNVIVQWATILSPIIAVLIAWWMSKSSKEDTAKQIESKNQKEIIISITSLSKTLRISEKVLSRIRRN